MSVVLISGLVVLSGCPKKAELASLPQGQNGSEASPAAQAADDAATGADAARETAKNGETSDEAQERAAAAKAGLNPVYFDYDRSVIRADAREVLLANAEWLKANPTAKLRIEGNCDERGAIEYNQALGQRRAAGARKYLADQGIAAERISLVSYGKEKPVCTAQTEECWQKNRRGDFVVVTE
jgi:peptidoglycan-associated lipoprotein